MHSNFNDLKTKTMTAKEYLLEIGFDDAHLPELFNNDDKSYYKITELMEEYHQAKLKLLGIGGVSGTVCLEDAKKVLLRYDQAIKEEIAVKLEWLRDHGTHAEFCDIITDIRENVLDTYR